MITVRLNTSHVIIDPKTEHQEWPDASGGLSERLFREMRREKRQVLIVKNKRSIQGRLINQENREKCCGACSHVMPPRPTRSPGQRRCDRARSSSSFLAF